MKLELIARRLAKGYCTLKELGSSVVEMRKLIDLGYRVQSHVEKGIRYFYITANGENTSLFISALDKEPAEHRWLELSDIHAGSKQFDEQGLKEILKRAVDEGYYDVHIAGDLCDGYKVYPGHITNLRYWTAHDQANYLASILVQFPLYYYASHGNHDFSFEMHGSPNPVAIIAQELPNQFTYFPSYAADMVLGGVLKRMVHGASGRSYARSYPGQTYIRDLLDGQGEHAYVLGKKYRLRFLQLGHWHTLMYYEAAGIVVTHSGNFQFPNDFTIRKGLVGSQGGRLVKVKMHKGKVLDYETNIIKPRRSI